MGDFGDQRIRIQQEVSDDPVRQALKEQQKEIAVLRRELEKTAKVSKRGADDAAEATRKHTKSTKEAKDETSLLGGAVGKIGPAIAAAFSVGAIKNFIAEVQKARVEAGELGRQMQTGSAQSALDAGLSRKYQNMLRAVQVSTRTSFNPAETEAITNAVMGAVAPVTEEQQRIAVDATRIALGMNRSVGMDAKKAEAVSMAAGQMIRQNPGIDTQFAFDIAARAFAEQGGTAALANLEKNSAVLRDIAPELGPEERVVKGLTLGIMLERGGMRVQTGASALSSLNEAFQKYKTGDTSAFDYKEQGGEVMKGALAPRAFREAKTTLDAFRMLLDDAISGDQLSIDATEKLFGSQAAKLRGSFENKDEDIIFGSLSKSHGDIKRREGIVMQNDATRAAILSAEQKRASDFFRQQRAAGPKAQADMAQEDLRRLIQESGGSMVREKLTMFGSHMSRALLPDEMFAADQNKRNIAYRDRLADSGMGYVNLQSDEETKQLLRQIADNTSSQNITVNASGGGGGYIEAASY